MDNFGKKEELSYLNNLTLTRIKDTNVIWLTSLGTVAGLIGLSVQTKMWVLTYIALFMLPAFIYSISWQLDGIARIRTYVKVCIEPILGGEWETRWPQHPYMNKRVILFSVPLIYSWIYLFATSLLCYLGWLYRELNIWIFIAIYSIPLIAIVISLYSMLNSFSMKAFMRYEAGWMEIKLREESTTQALGKSNAQSVDVR